MHNVGNRFITPEFYETEKSRMEGLIKITTNPTEKQSLEKKLISFRFSYSNQVYEQKLTHRKEKIKTLNEKNKSLEQKNTVTEAALKALEDSYQGDVAYQVGLAIAHERNALEASARAEALAEDLRKAEAEKEALQQQTNSKSHDLEQLRNDKKTLLRHLEDVSADNQYYVETISAQESRLQRQTADLRQMDRVQAENRQLSVANESLRDSVESNEHEITQLKKRDRELSNAVERERSAKMSKTQDCQIAAERLALLTKEMEELKAAHALEIAAKSKTITSQAVMIEQLKATVTAVGKAINEVPFIHVKVDSN